MILLFDAEHTRPVTRKILDLARTLVPDEHAAIDWYYTDAITVFQGLTAAQLVTQGRGEQVILFLRNISAQETSVGSGQP